MYSVEQSVHSFAICAQCYVVSKSHFYEVEHELESLLPLLFPNILRIFRIFRKINFMGNCRKENEEAVVCFYNCFSEKGATIKFTKWRRKLEKWKTKCAIWRTIGDGKWTNTVKPVLVRWPG